MEEKLEIVCNFIVVGCLILGIVIGLLGIWSAISPDILWKSFYSVLLLFSGALILNGVIISKNKLGT